MYRTPQKAVTPPKQQSNSTSRSPIKHSGSKTSLSATKQTLNQDPYFCHYKNAMYMGRVKAFQKDGRGILLHDDGSSAVTSYDKDMLHGLNLVLTPNDNLISANYSKNKLVDVAYKTDGMLFYGKFNAAEQLDGPSVVVDFSGKQIIHANAKKGQIVQKSTQTNQAVINRVFQNGNLSGLVPADHIKNLSLEVQKGNNMDIIRRGNKVTIGYTKGGFLNGLAIVMGHRIESKGSNIPDFNVQLIQRGYYKNHQLYGLGERRYKNGNVYVGQFKNDVFEGVGILRNNLKQNWVSGQFERGNLIQLGKYSNQGNQKTSSKIMQSIHQKKTSWVSKQVSLTNPSFLDKQIKKILQFTVNQQMASLEMRRQQMLRRIQDNFLSDAQEGQEAIVKVNEVQDSPLQRYLKPQQQPINQTSFENISYERSAKNSFEKGKSSFDTNKLSSSRRNKIFTNPANPNPPQRVSKQEYMKEDSYHLEVYPVPVDNPNYSSRRQLDLDEVIERKPNVLQLKKQQYGRQSFNNESLNLNSNKRQDPGASSSGRMRDSKMLVGPRVQLFTPQKQDEKRTSKSPSFGYKTTVDMKKRKEDIIESMYRRQMKRSFI